MLLLLHNCSHCILVDLGLKWLYSTFMETISLTILKNKLSDYIARVVSGAEFLVTNHGKPVAKLVPLAEEGSITVEEKLAVLAKSGRVQYQKPVKITNKPFQVKISGFSASDLLISMRK